MNLIERECSIMNIIIFDDGSTYDVAHFVIK